MPEGGFRVLMWGDGVPEGLECHQGERERQNGGCLRVKSVLGEGGGRGSGGCLREG